MQILKMLKSHEFRGFFVVCGSGRVRVFPQAKTGNVFLLLNCLQTAISFLSRKEYLGNSEINTLN